MNESEWDEHQTLLGLKPPIDATHWDKDKKVWLKADEKFSWIWLYWDFDAWKFFGMISSKEPPELIFKTVTEEDIAVEQMMSSGAIKAFYDASGGDVNNKSFEALFRKLHQLGYKKDSI
jgi:hypothetical protein